MGLPNCDSNHRIKEKQSKPFSNRGWVAFHQRRVKTNRVRAESSVCLPANFTVLLSSWHLLFWCFACLRCSPSSGPSAGGLDVVSIGCQDSRTLQVRKQPGREEVPGNPCNAPRLLLLLLLLSEAIGMALGCTLWLQCLPPAMSII